MSNDIETFSGEHRHFEPSDEYRKTSRVPSRERYEELYRESLDEPEKFWGREIADLTFRERHEALVEWDLPFAKWFVGARLNVSESCLDRHLSTDVADKPAIIWESEPGESTTLTYAQLTEKVKDFAAALRNMGVRSGDRVAIYMGMVPEALVGMLACARIGAPHTVVFGGFAADSLRDRILDCDAKVVLTQDAAWRRGKPVDLKGTVDAAVAQTPCVEKVVVFKRFGDAAQTAWHDGRDVDWYEAVEAGRGKASTEPEIVDAEHPLFILYTSGSTGKPKGILHTSAGYLVGAHVSTKYVFDLRDDDVYWCTADIGWITGHSYMVYGPLSNGATCVVYEGAPNYPDWGRFWQVIDKHRVTILYTAPTAIRAFIKAGDDWVNRASLASLRLLGTVGEPINPDVWMWYREKVGKNRCPIVDTWWQTETGSILMTTLPGAVATKPGATGLPFFGVEPDIVSSEGESLPANHGGYFVMRRPWPSMLRSIWGDDERFKKQYFSDVPGCYFTGDGASRDEEGYINVVGRIDDVLNVSGHRIGTAEIESSLVAHPAVAEAAAVGRPDDLKGQALVAFVTLKPGSSPGADMASTLKEHVAREIGKFARPEEIRFADAVPKTRSGKIMRRLLKDIAAGRDITGDVSTLEDASVLEQLMKTH